MEVLMGRLMAILLATLSFIFLSNYADACTTTLVTAGATVG